MTRTVLTLCCIVCMNLCYSQTFDTSTMNDKSLTEFVNKIKNDNKIDATKAITLISDFNKYPKIDKLGVEYLFFYSDSLFGQVPVRVYIPKKYNFSNPNPVILLLHGTKE